MKLQNLKLAGQKLGTSGGILFVDAQGCIELDRSKEALISALLKSGFRDVSPLEKAPEEKSEKLEEPKAKRQYNKKV